jgi:hypothetical protein
MRIVNFSHPLTERNLEEIKTLAGSEVIEVINAQRQLNLDKPLEQQIEGWLEELGIAPEEWQTQPTLFNLPALNYGASVLLAMLHGRMGYFPPVLRLRPDTAGMVPRFVVTEILNLQAIRERARGKR